MMVKHIDRIIFGGKSKIEAAPNVFIGLLIFGLLTTIYYIILTDPRQILLRSIITIFMLLSFVVIERSRLSVQLVALLNPFCQIALLTVGAIIFDGDFLLYMYTLFWAMVSLMYLKPKGVLFYTFSIAIVHAVIMLIFSRNLVGPNFSRPQQYSGLVATFAINLMIYAFCESYSKATHAKEVFLSNMSHEIRTPISSVIGLSEIMLKNDNLSKDTTDSFIRIHRSSKLLLRIINDILDFSKMQEDKLPIINEKYELINLISDIHHPYYENDSNLQFDVDVSPTLPSVLEGDSARILQVLGNIISNAFKYTEEGKVKLKIYQEESTGDKEEYNENGMVNLYFSVKDTGVGMTEDQLNKVYDDYIRFYENKNVGGTGLGMSISKKLVQLMNGKMHVKSSKGIGTKVDICIPQKILDYTPIGSYPSEAPITNTAKDLTDTVTFAKSGKVLVVDDMEINLFVAKGLIQLSCIAVEEATSAQMAIDLVKQGNQYDIIFMDSMMPDISGSEALTMLRKMGYTAPVVVLTADAVQGTKESYLKHGFNNFLSKPIILEELNEILAQYIS